MGQSGIDKICIVCPLCRETSNSEVLLYPTPLLIGTTTEIYNRLLGPQPFLYQAHMCGRCGFAGFISEFGEEDLDLKEFEKDIRKKFAVTAHKSSIPASDKYEAIAQIAEWRAWKPIYIAERLRDAAWCAFEENDYEGERFFRRKAAWAYEKALDNDFDEEINKDRAKYTYLLGEMWRRVGDILQAKVWFNRALIQATEKVEDEWIEQLTLQQRDSPDDWIQKVTA